MSDEPIQESATTETLSTTREQELLSRIDALDRKNKEILEEKRKFVKVEKTLQTLPEGTDVQALIDFKNKAEQEKLESQGKYSEALQSREQQFRDAVKDKDQKIIELEARVKEMELITPAVSALADIVHDPDLVMKTKLSSDKIERDADGTVVVVDGYERTPVTEWAKKLPAWMQKTPPPQGGGAPIGKARTGGIPAGTKNPFASESFNLTEQSRLYKTDRDLYEKLKAAING